MRILLVENNPVTASYLLQLFALQVDTLGRPAFQVEWAVNGNCVRIKLPVMKPDMILLDYFLGDCDGLSILKEVRVDPRVEKIPVILTTAAGDKDIPAELPRGVRLLRKPFEFSELLAAINEMMAVPV